MDSLGSVQSWEERNFRPGDKILLTIKTQSLNDQQNAFFDNGREMEFTVSEDSVINIPLIGEIKVCNYNRSGLVKFIKSKVGYFIKDPFVQVKPLQIQVKVLGLVERQGIITMPENDATLASLLAQVGGVAQFSKKDSLLVIREELGLRKSYYVDLRSGTGFFNSPVYKLKQNDIVVVKPSDYFFKSARNQEVGINIGRITPVTVILGILMFLYPIINIINR